MVLRSRPDHRRFTIPARLGHPWPDRTRSYDGAGRVSATPCRYEALVEEVAMSADQQRELQAAIQSDMSLQDIVVLLRRHKALGVSPEEVHAFLDSWRETIQDEAL